MVRRPRILFVHGWAPGTGAGGGQRMTHLLDAARAVGEVTTFAPEPYPARPWPWLAARTAHAAADMAVARSWNHGRGDYPREGIRRFAELQPQAYDVILMKPLATIWRTGWVDSTRTIIDLDDIPSDQLCQRINDRNVPLRLAKWCRYQWVRITERRLLDRYRFVMVASEDARRYLDHPHVSVVPNVYWPHNEMQLDPVLPEAETIPLLFVGSLFYEPNRRGLSWFIEHVLPLIRRHVEGATLTVIGQTFGRTDGGLDTWSNRAGVQLVGTVPDVVPFIRQAQIEVCPVLDGGGTLIKILESLALAKPVVSTTLGAYGHPLGESEGLLRRDDAESFATACVSLITDADRRRRIGLAGREAVLDRYHPRVVHENVRRLVENIVNDNGLVT